MKGLKAGLAVAVVLVALPASASAGTAKVEVVDAGYGCGSLNSLTFFDSVGVVNKVTVAEQDVYVDTGIGFIGPCNYYAYRETTAVVSDSAYPVTAGNRCRSLQPKVAECEVAAAFDGIGQSRIYLGEGSDYLALNLTTTLGLPRGSIVYGGGGNDTLRTTNGARDTVDCGPGTDSVVRDPNDVLTNCETVTP